MSQMETSFFIAGEDIPQTLSAIHQLPNKRYSWVNDFHNLYSLEEVMREWRWDINFDEEGNVIDIEFIGEKLGDDPLLFEAIAPFVKDGSCIEMLGEDGDRWRWSFTNGSMKILYPTVVWD